MRGFVSGMATGVVMMAATHLLAAAPSVLTLSSDAPMAGEMAGAADTHAALQRVNRTNKADRLDAANRSVIHQQRLAPDREPERMLTGCEPAISPLSVSVSAGNFPRHCVA